MERIIRAKNTAKSIDAEVIAVRFRLRQRFLHAILKYSFMAKYLGVFMRLNEYLLVFMSIYEFI